MYVKRVAYFSILLFIFSVFAATGAATTTNSISFHGVGVTVELTFPNEAHPTENITHNATITADTALTMENFTIVIYAQTDTALVHVKNQTLPPWSLTGGETLTYRLSFTFTPNLNATIRCFIYVKTAQSFDYASFTSYTTRVQQQSYGDLLAAYNELTLNRSVLLTEYANLLGDYNDLLSENDGLVSSQQNLQNDYDGLLANYTDLLASHQTLQNSYSASEASYDELLQEHQTLQDEVDNLQLDYNNLKDSVDTMEQTKDLSENERNNGRVVILVLAIVVGCLIASIAYMKRKKQEPYLVIRKETVALDKDKQ